MLLRIEDTDRERSTEPAIEAILDGLTWLGLDWDGEAVYQFARAARHREVGREPARRRRAPTAATRARRSSRRCARRRAPRAGRCATTGAGATATRPRRPPASSRSSGCAPPNEGETVVEDEVQGRVVWQNKDLDDLVLLRSDGTPTYMLAVVVDDHDMGVTHIIRGDDHLTNAARQTQIYEALGWAMPAMAHIPLIHGADGAKLSKRHGALGVDAYRTMGYLPAALRNYLVRLGWSHGDQEIFSTEEMIAAFDLAADRPLAGPLRLRQAREPQRPLHPRRCRTRRWSRARDHPARASARRAGSASVFRPSSRQKLIAAMPGLKERAKTLVELLDSASFLYASRPLPLDDEGRDTPRQWRARARRRSAAGSSSGCRDWDARQRRRRRCAASPRRPASSSGRWRSRCARR